MKNKNGFGVSDNPQRVVDAENHLIRDYRMSNQVTDHSLKVTTVERIHGENVVKISELVADKGYSEIKDRAGTLRKRLFHKSFLMREQTDMNWNWHMGILKQISSSTETEEIWKYLHGRGNKICEGS